MREPKQAAEQEDVLLPEERELYAEFELVLKSIADAATQKAERLLEQAVEEMRAARQEIAQLQSEVQRLKLHIAVLTWVAIIGIGITLALQVWR